MLVSASQQFLYLSNADDFLLDFSIFLSSNLLNNDDYD